MFLNCLTRLTFGVVELNKLMAKLVQTVQTLPYMDGDEQEVSYHILGPMALKIKSIQKTLQQLMG
mgnify:CR=1 FL=1